jgi:hypothetical protein
MDCSSIVSLKTRRRSVLTVALFVVFLAVCPGFALPNGFFSGAARQYPAQVGYSVGPFSTVAVGVTAGTLGAGVELVTPISRRTNLRVDGHFFNYSQTLEQDGISYSGNLRLRDFRASYDLYPFKGGFRLSGGVAVYNQFNVAANAAVPANKTLTLNDVDYYSSAADPLHGNASIAYGRKVAPTLTFGWGNAIPRSGRHLAFPVELGMAFTGTPKFDLDMFGSACSVSSTAGCAVVSSYPDFQTNLAAQRRKINNDLQPLRFYPILSLGVTYRF